MYSYYIALIFLVYFLVTNRRMMRQVLTGLMVSSIGVFTIVILEVNNLEIGIYRPLRSLIFMGTDSANDVFVDLFYTLYQGRIKPGFQFVTGPLFNPNYLGVYGGVLVVLGIGLLWTEKRRGKSLFYGCLTGFAYCILLLSGANASFYLMLLCVAVQIIYVLIRKSELKVLFVGYKGKLLGLLLGGIGLFIGMNMLSEGAVYREFVDKYLPSESGAQDILSEVRSAEIQDIRFEEASVTFDDGLQTVSFVVKDDRIQPDLREDEREQLEGWQFDTGKADEPYAFKHNGKTIYLGTDRNGKLGVVTSYGLVQELSTPVPLIMDGHGISNRGYIWSVAIHLICQQPFIGHGPDTYPIYQPQGDLLNLLRFRSSTSSTAINPHNLYLQWAFIAGVVGLACMLISLIWIVIQGSIRMIQGDVAGLYIFVPLLFFLATSLVNDTIVGTGFILYMLIGMVFAWLYNGCEEEDML